MQLTIDSDKQPLADVLRVIGALYDVEVGSPSTPSTPRKRVAKRASAPSPGKRATGRRARRRGPSPADIRAWAASNGHEISARGRISTSVLDAYKAATSR